LPGWDGWLGWLASAIYLLRQTELHATAIPGFPVVDWAGLAGSLLWLLWTIILGIILNHSKAEPVVTRKTSQDVLPA
jgi:hypothetical protein